MRPLYLAAALCLIAAPCAAQGPNVFLFDVLRRPDYKAAYENMLKGERGLPSWMATVDAAIATTETPGTSAKLGSEQREIFTACEPHNCGGHELVVMFAGFGSQVAKAVLAIDGSFRFLGKPNAAEAKLLLAQVSN